MRQNQFICWAEPLPTTRNQAPQQNVCFQDWRRKCTRAWNIPDSKEAIKKLLGSYKKKIKEPICMNFKNVTEMYYNT